MLPKDVHIKITARFDGGVRITCDEMPGLILSGTDPGKVVAAIWPALLALDEHRPQLRDPKDGFSAFALLRDRFFR